MTRDQELDTTTDNDKKLPFSFDPGSRSGLYPSSRSQSILSLSASTDGQSGGWSDFTASPGPPAQPPSPLALSPGRALEPSVQEDSTPYKREIERLRRDLEKYKLREQFGEPRPQPRQSRPSSNTTVKEASLIVHERVVIVTPRVLIAQGDAAHETPLFQTPQPSFDEARDLADLANSISPLSTDFSLPEPAQPRPTYEDTPQPSYQEARDLAQLALEVGSGCIPASKTKNEPENNHIDDVDHSKVTVTDEETQAQVELDFNTPTPPCSDSEFIARNGSFSSEEEDDFFNEEPKPSETPQVINKPQRGNSPVGGRSPQIKPTRESQHFDQVKPRKDSIEKEASSQNFDSGYPKEGNNTAARKTLKKQVSLPKFPTVRNPLPDIDSNPRAGLRSSPVTGRRKSLASKSGTRDSESSEAWPGVSRVHVNSFSDSDDDSKYVERIRKEKMRGRDRSRDASLERPSWGFGNSRVPSRQEVGEGLGGRTSRAHSRAASRSSSRTDLYAQTGLTYDDVVQTSAGNSLLPEPGGRKLSRRNSSVSMMSNISSKWREDLKNYQAIKITIYKNGDQWFNGFELRFKPNKDFQDFDAFLGKISPRIDFTTSVSYLFDTDGNRIKNVAEFEDGQSYVASNTRRFVPANYGRTGEAFWMNGKRYSRNNPYRKRSGSSISSSTDSKPGSGDGKVIKIVNNEDTTISEKVLLNLRTSQTFEEVVKDLGQVLKIKGADKMYTTQGNEVKSFSQLRNDHYNEDVFVISAGASRVSRSVSRMSRGSGPPTRSGSKPPSRSQSRTRDADSPGSIKILVNGARKVFYAPTNHPRDPGSPNGKLGLEWVYGYRGIDQNKNLWVLEKGELVYYVGAVAIVYNRMDEKQRHYRGHSEDITCMDLHPLGDTMVSGQQAGLGPEAGAQVRVWNVHNMETLQVLGLGSMEVGVAGVGFSVLNKGAYVAAVDRSKESILHLWDWANNDLLSKVSVDATVICGVSFHPFDNNLVITYGKAHLAFWNRKKDGFFARADLAESTPGICYQCLAFLESGDVVTGDNEGNINSYSVSAEGEYYRSFSLPAHIKGVSSLLVMAQGTLLSAGERDRKITAWDSNRDFVMIGEAELPAAAGSGRSLYPQWPTRNDGNVYVGTTTNIILEGSLQRKFNMVIFGHTKPISAVSTHPSDASFITAGGDKVVAKWRRSKLLWKVQVQSVCLSCCHHPGGGVVAVGTADGHMIIVTEDSGTHVTTVRMCGAGIAGVKYNEDGDLVAGASMNGSVYIYKVSRDGFAYKKYSKISGGQQLTQIDWDNSGDFLQTSSADYSLNFWNTANNKLEKVPSVLRNKEWMDQTCVIGWAVSGLWNNHNYKEAANIESVHVGHYRELLASGDSHGNVRLFGFPAINDKSEFHEDKPMSGPVLSTKFFADDSYVIAVGGLEAGLFKYKIK